MDAIRKCGLGILVIAGLGVISIPVAAQTYPARPLRIVVPFAPGGAADTTARVIGQGLSSRLGKPVVVDNRPGGGGNIGAELVAKATPDGHTLLLGGVQQVIAANLHAKLGYDLLRDLVPISLLASSPLVVSVNPSVTAKTVKELVALARSRPNELGYSSAGIGSGLHLAGVLFCEMAAVRMNHVPFKGGVPGLIAVAGGDVAVGFSAITAVMPHIRTGKLRALGVSGRQRSAAIPDVPTISEAGLPGYEAELWYGLHAPAGTPGKAISRVHAESVKVLQLSDVQDRLKATDIELHGTAPAQYDAYIRSELAKWAKTIKAAGIKPE